MSRGSAVLGIILGTMMLGCATPTPAVSPTVTPLAQQSVNVGQNLPITATVTIAGRKINLEVARTPQEQATGLMYRDTIADDRGMLFVFEPARPVGFWMKNVRFPLDMIFLENGRVKAIAPAVPPCQAEPCPTYGPETPVNQVIELRGGRAAELGIRVGDRLDIRFLDSQTLNKQLSFTTSFAIKGEIPQKNCSDLRLSRVI
nr:DUF192 domain-containing protein [Chroogloeocystis siderophila]